MKKIIISFLVGAAITFGSIVFISAFPHKPDRKLVPFKTVGEYMDSAYNENLIQAGFTNTMDAKNYAISRKRKYFKDKGYNFYSDEETKQFLKDNDFVLGESSRYLKNVPADAGKEIIHAITKLKHDAPVYTLTLTHRDNTSFALTDNEVLIHTQNASWRSGGDNVSTVVTADAMEALSIPNDWFWELHYNSDLPIYVIGAANEFNLSGMNIIDGILKAIPPKDPIALLKVQGGYVQIAQW